MSKVIRFSLPIVIACAFGPLIAGLAVSLFAVANSLFPLSEMMSLEDIGSTLVLFIIMAYVIGEPVALLSGLLLSLWMLFRPPTLTVVIGVTVIATSLFFAIGALGLLGPVELTNAQNNFVFTLVLAVIAATGCWLGIWLVLGKQKMQNAVGARSISQSTAPQ